MMNTEEIMNWVRVSKKDPCKVCHKPDYCTWNPHLNMAHCMRVTSDRPSRNKMGGYLHKLGGEIPKYLPPIRKSQAPSIDCVAVLARWRAGTKANQLTEFAEILGVDPLALYRVGCSFVPSEELPALRTSIKGEKIFAIPMHDENSKVCGIRLRNELGDKWAVTGSKQGVFLSTDPLSGTTFIVEGPTDAAAAINLGISVIGRPSCMGCHDTIAAILKSHKVRRAVIFSDNDGPGMAGAEKLQEFLPISSCLFIPPSKDMRQLFNHGVTAAVIEAMVSGLVWTHKE